ncbi:MAG: AAA family ATPase, partial [Nannocystaceae bacterium]
MSDQALRRRLDRCLRAGGRLISLRTAEERHAVALLEELADGLGWPCHTYSVASGVDGAGGERDVPVLTDILRALLDRPTPALWILHDIDGPQLTPRTLRLLRELSQKTRGPAIVVTGVVTGPVAALPEAARVELGPPALDELRARCEALAPRLVRAGHVDATAALADHGDAIARAGLGLSRHRFDQLVAEAIQAAGEVHGPAIVAYLRAHKPDAVEGAGLLERLTPPPLEHVGGLAAYKRWLARRALALDPRAQAAGIPAPRGALLVGVQGCGKSLAARATAAALELPLLRLEPGRLFGGTVGESEANLRAVTEAAERLAPAVLWIDEIDKALAGSEGAQSDAGTAARVVGGLLTWLQERDRPVFVVMTANRVDALPPELLRRGRLDELFFVDLPGPEERAVILQIHLQAIPAAKLGEPPPLADPIDAYL